MSKTIFCPIARDTMAKKPDEEKRVYKGWMGPAWFLQGEEQDDGEWLGYVFELRRCKKRKGLDWSATEVKEFAVPVRITRTRDRLVVERIYEKKR